MLLTSSVNASSHPKRVSSSYKISDVELTLINLHPNQYSQELHCYLLAVKLDRYVGSWNTFNDLSNKVCVPNKTEDVNTHIFNVMARINESKILTKHVSCKCKCKIYGRKCNSNQKWNNDKSWYKCKKTSDMWKGFYLESCYM